MKILKNLNKKNFLYFLIFITAIIFVFVGLNRDFGNDASKGNISISEERPAWNLYKNEVYNFEISYPSNWELHEEFEESSPTINIYIPNGEVEPPFDHFAEINNVSIFPKGLQTEAVIGQSKESDLDLDINYNSATDYLLEDGTVWATYINPDDLEDPWKTWGFIWVRNTIDDIEYKCISNESEVSLDYCNPFEGDEFIRAGSVDQDMRETQEEIIKSFKLIEN